jgi:hypothetical protein
MPGKHPLPLAAQACLALALASCGSGGSGSTDPASAGVAGAAYGITQSNLEIATALYQDSQRTPPGFLADPPPPGAGLVSTHHLQSDELALSAASSYEVCSDDWNQALDWSEQTATQGGTYASLVGNSDTSHYFEFDRVRAGTPALLLRQRVYLCSYLDRSDSSAAVATGPAGVLNAQPRNAAEMRGLAEYLWHFTSWNNYGSAVLASVADSGSAELGHSLLIATVTPDGISAGCDRIEVLKWRHSMSLASGALQRSLTPLWSFAARQSGNIALDCAAG